MDFLFRKVLKEALNYCYNQLELYIPLGIGNLKKNVKKKIKNERILSSINKGQIKNDGQSLE